MFAGQINHSTDPFFDPYLYNSFVGCHGFVQKYMAVMNCMAEEVRQFLNRNTEKSSTGLGVFLRENSNHWVAYKDQVPDIRQDRFQ